MTDERLELVQVTVRQEVRRARRADRWVLTSWGLAVLLLAGLFSLALWRQQVEQNRAMCGLMAPLVAGPEPVPGPAGDRARSVLAGMRRYLATLDCPKSR